MDDNIKDLRLEGISMDLELKFEEHNKKIDRFLQKLLNDRESFQKF